ncbi:hypothetical protein FA15DRAFT_624186 [Coprinopsis marcescibilis]|uniref:PH domain-containing protein n=1 Tax=Coprinopsis marcescibilis TaxID=230819 RepID=A0A5C3KMX5_COPMA|nr:hypothetical protein FA15DRAFT_624186 [Coprinopsis marcescibilis]
MNGTSANYQYTAAPLGPEALGNMRSSSSGNLAGHHQGNLSRATSRTSARPLSTLSKSQSLIKKNIEVQDLRPADVLIERFVAWKAIVKQLTMYFEGIADIENNTAKELAKLAGVIQVPFKSGNQFLGEGGLQDVYYGIRDKTRTISDQHANLGRTIDSSIVQHLQKLLAEIKAHIRNVQNDTGKLAAGVAKEREMSTRLVGELANSVSMYKNTPMNIPAKNDPFIANQAVHRQLSRQVLEENLLQKSLIITQQNSAHFESGIVRSIQSAWQTFDEFQSRTTSSSSEIYRALAQHMAAQAPEKEWIAFASRSDHLVDPETPMRDVELVRYPLKDDPATRAVHTGNLERRVGGFAGKSWREGYYVLTPAGFLHEFRTSDVGGKDGAGLKPVFSLFLPNCTLGPVAAPGAGQHKFHIEGRKDGDGNAGSGGKIGASGFKAFMLGSVGGDTGASSAGAGSAGGGGSSKSWTFKARSREDMLEWWNDIRMLCARYLVASEVVQRSGPVEYAVRSVGYAQEDLEEEGVYYEDEEGEGSSVEEEEDEVVGDMYMEVVGRETQGEAEGEQPPGYTSAHSARYADVGPNGYLMEKKRGPSPHVYDERNAPVPVPMGGHSAPAGGYDSPRGYDNGRGGGGGQARRDDDRYEEYLPAEGYVYAEQQVYPYSYDGERQAAQGDSQGQGETNTVKRRYSKRQAEKAPERGTTGGEEVTTVGDADVEGDVDVVGDGMGSGHANGNGNGVPIAVQNGNGGAKREDGERRYVEDID